MIRFGSCIDSQHPHLLVFTREKKTLKVVEDLSGIEFFKETCVDQDAGTSGKDGVFFDERRIVSNGISFALDTRHRTQGHIISLCL